MKTTNSPTKNNLWLSHVVCTQKFHQLLTEKSFYHKFLVQRNQTIGMLFLPAEAADESSSTSIQQLMNESDEQEVGNDSSCFIVPAQTQDSRQNYKK